MSKIKFQKSPFYSIFFCLFFIHQTLFATEFNLVVGLIPPYIVSYNYNNKNEDEVSGNAIEIIIGALKESKIPYKVGEKGIPWTRAVELYLNEKDSLSFKTKVDKLNTAYKWIAPILDDDLHVFTLTTQSPVDSIDALKTKKRIGVLPGVGSDYTIVSLGLKNNRYFCKDDKQCLDLLRAGEIDAWVASIQKSNYRIKESNMIGKVHKGIRVLDTSIWAVTSNKTDEKDFLLLKEAFEKFVKTTKYTDIIKKYEL